MNVLLINLKSDITHFALMPISLLYLAQPLLEAGVNVEIIDQRFETDFFETLRSSLAGDITAVGISCITGPQLNELIAVTTFIRSISGVPIVVGGSHVTIFPEQTLASHCIDYVVIGKGELPFLNLVRALADNSFQGLPMVGHKVGGDIVITKGDVPDYTSSSVPYHLIAKYGKYSTVSILSSRGCLYDCAFCAIKAIYPGYTEFPVPNVVAMIQDAVRLEPLTIQFLDDNFLSRVRRVIDLFQVCRQNDLRFRWVCSARVDEVLRIDDQVLFFLKQASLTGIFLGVESGSQRILDLINKKIRCDMVLELNQKLKKFGIIPYYSFMVGFPTETDADREATFRLMDQLKRENSRAVIWKANNYTPYPSTKLYHLALEHGFKVPASLQEWSEKHPYSKEYDVPYDTRL